jgi:hypothetical protein
MVDPNSSNVDHALLYRVRETVLPQISRGGPPPPVDFTVRDGVVTIFGDVSSPEENQRIASLVQQVPGVVQVKNQAMLSSTWTQTEGSPVVGSAEISRTQTNTVQTGVSGTNVLTPTGRTNVPPPRLEQPNPPSDLRPNPPQGSQQPTSPPEPNQPKERPQ